MMRELFVDTETTGFVHGKLPLNHERQPHLVQLAMLLREDGEEVSRANMVVRCPVPVPLKAFEVHGYDQDKTQRLGVTPRTAGLAVHDMANNADLIIAHHADFDRQILEIALRRANVKVPWKIGGGLIGGASWFCSMKAAEPYCKIPASAAQIRAGFKKQGDFKQPKLEEALEALLGEKLENAHDALTDVVGCAKIYDWLVRFGNADMGVAT